MAQYSLYRIESHIDRAYFRGLVFKIENKSQSFNFLNEMASIENNPQISEDDVNDAYDKELEFVRCCINMVNEVEDMSSFVESFDDYSVIICDDCSFVFVYEENFPVFVKYQIEACYINEVNPNIEWKNMDFDEVLGNIASLSQPDNSSGKETKDDIQKELHAYCLPKLSMLYDLPVLYGAVYENSNKEYYIITKYVLDDFLTRYPRKVLLGIDKVVVNDVSKLLVQEEEKEL